MNRLFGKIAVITGAASGIGRAAAEAFISEGATVGLLDRNEEAVHALQNQLGASSFSLFADVTDEASIETAFQLVKERYGRLHVLYNCAGVQLHGEDTKIDELDLETWDKTIRVNLTGVFLSCKHGIRLMLEGARGGSVINCASPTGVTGCGAGYTAYSSSKGGVISLTRVLAIDFAKKGIRVNSIIPGTIETPLIHELLDHPEIKTELLAGTPLGRLGTPQDLTGVAVFLASDESSFATGANFFVDGGLTIR